MPVRASDLPPEVRKTLGVDESNIDTNSGRRRAKRRAEVPAAECGPLRCHRCGLVLYPATDGRMRRHDLVHGAGWWEVVLGA